MNYNVFKAIWEIQRTEMGFEIGTIILHGWKEFLSGFGNSNTHYEQYSLSPSTPGVHWAKFFPCIISFNGPWLIGRVVPDSYGSGRHCSREKQGQESECLKLQIFSLLFITPDFLCTNVNFFVLTEFLLILLTYAKSIKIAISMFTSMSWL